MKTTFALNWTAKTSVIAAVAFIIALAGHSPALEGVSLAVGQTSAPKSAANQADKTRAHLLQMASQVGETNTPALPDDGTMGALKSIEPAAHSAAAQERYERSIAKNKGDTLQPGDRFYRLHLASVADPEDVEETIETLKTLGSPELSGANFLAQNPSEIAAGNPLEAPVTSGFTRIFAGEFASRDIAQRACSILRSDGQYCSVLLVSQ